MHYGELENREWPTVARACGNVSFQIVFASGAK